MDFKYGDIVEFRVCHPSWSDKKDDWRPGRYVAPSITRPGDHLIENPAKYDVVQYSKIADIRRPT